jgi:hypothetical protein
MMLNARATSAAKVVAACSIALSQAGASSASVMVTVNTTNTARVIDAMPNSTTGIRADTTTNACQATAMQQLLLGIMANAFSATTTVLVATAIGINIAKVFLVTKGYMTDIMLDVGATQIGSVVLTRSFAVIAAKLSAMAVNVQQTLIVAPDTDVIPGVVGVVDTGRLVVVEDVTPPDAGVTGVVADGSGEVSRDRRLSAMSKASFATLFALCMYYARCQSNLIFARHALSFHVLRKMPV